MADKGLCTGLNRAIDNPARASYVVLIRTDVQDATMSNSASGLASRPMARGAQLPLMPQLSLTPSIRRSEPRNKNVVCPHCAGPTASHGRRFVCVVCGFGGQTIQRRRRRTAVRRVA